MAPQNVAAATATIHAFRQPDADATTRVSPLGETLEQLYRLSRKAGLYNQGDWESTLTRLAEAAQQMETRLAEHAARLDHLESLSVTDELTGLNNRRGFRRELTKALARADRGGETGILMLVDLDHFKPINDTYGHGAGDAVLVAIGRVLNTAVRHNDATGRIGGDEFAVLLSNADPVAVQPRVLRLRNALSQLVVQHNGVRIPMRATLGQADYGPGTDADALLHAADVDLYRHKR
ncbi:GGDEF domain-containing protein [Rhodovibrio salinarum]|uniref:diguanylate cyclase n=1 Tax=Rhodovibrio salinarum TaxID=1087 RepID=A0A934QI98_9PROT|nr:GGDEF domain-containing protein [Rhodovibrio salinarum]MBK1697531.1 GGDEF domain-containing protein [Rhodovibrio salinarum]